MSNDDVRVATIIETLRCLGDGYMETASDNQWLIDRAAEIEGGLWRELACCPLCSEVQCDDNCPMRQIRA